MAKISKPDANPVVAALLTWLLFGTGHLIVNGQQKKWLFCLLMTFLSCCLAPITAILSIIEAYKTAEKLKAGKEIDENEYSFKPMFKIAKILHKDAILVE